MMKYFVFPIVILILTFTASGIYATAPQDITIDESERTVTCKFMDLKELMEHRLQIFLTDKGGKDNKELKDFYVNRRVVFPEDVSNYYQKRSLKVTLNLNKNTVDFKGKVNLGIYKNQEVSYPYYIHGKGIVRKLNNHFSITGDELKDYHAFREKVMDIVAPDLIKYYIESGEAYIRDNAVYLKLKIKEKLPLVSSRDKITPDKILIKTVYRVSKAKGQQGPVLIKQFKTAFQGGILSLKMNTAGKKQKPLYTVISEIAPTYRQNVSSILSKYTNGKSSFKSYRTNATVTLLKNKKTLFTRNFTKAGMHIADVQARISSSQKTAKAAMEAVVRQIIIDIFKVTVP